MTRRLRPAVLAVLALLVAGLLAGCVGMPEDGPVVETRDRGTSVADQGAPFIDPLPPQRGASPPEVVIGFLNAMQATPVQTRTAKEFLTKEAAASWNPQRETITYAVRQTPRVVNSGVAVTLTGANHLDSRGGWQGPLSGGTRTFRFPMVFEDDAWRIDRAPDALIVPEDWFQGRFRQVSLYFFDATGGILEPEPVFVPRGEQLASTLTQALLMGPGPGLGRVAQSFVPAGLKVAVGVTISDDGVADVLLTGDPGQLTAKTVELMMAQFAWTLRQEPSIESVRVSIGDEPVPLPGGVSTYRVDGGQKYDPAGYRASPLLYGLRRGLLVSGTATALEPVAGPLGEKSYGLRSVGVNLRATMAAGVTADGRTVLAAPVTRTDSGSVRTVATGTDLLRPGWDFAGRMWLVDRTDRGARVSYVEDGRVHGLRVPGITGKRVRRFLVSRDGTRLVAVVRRAGDDLLVVSRIEHGPTGPVVGALRAERIDVGDDVDLPIRDISWRTSATIAVLNPLTPTLAEVSTASVDGAPTQIAATAVEGEVRSLAGSPAEDEPIYGVTRAGLVDVANPDRRAIPLAPRTRAVMYVG